jgi:hypothetical protein
MVSRVEASPRDRLAVERKKLAEEVSALPGRRGASCSADVI